MGSLPGYPQDAADKGFGFNDPNEKYPSTITHSNHTLKESDVSRLARGEDGENHKSLQNRRTARLKSIPTATKPNLTGVSTELTSAETRGSFDEPHPRGISTTGTSTGQYPFNHVHESESGHISEIDDTPGGERLHREHKSGTYEEIVADGTRTVKVVGDDYELVAGSSNIQVKGNINLTCDGTKREFVRGDYILEVAGNYSRKIGKSEQVKIGYLGAGNLEEVILGNHGYNISGAVKGAIGTNSELQSRDFDLNVGGNFGTTVGGDHFITSVGEMSLQSVSKNVRITALSNIGLTSVGKLSCISGDDMAIKSRTKLNIKSEAVGSMVFAGSGSTINLSGSGSTITTTQEVTANTIALTTHVHSQGADSAGDSQVNTNAPVA